MEPIKGWVAWHPVEGARTVALSKAKCEENLTGIMLLYFQRYEEYSIAHESELRRLTDNGWQIREVELRFTDEEQITFANGATVELVGDGEEAFVGIDWEKKKDEEEKQDER